MRLRSRFGFAALATIALASLVLLLPAISSGRHADGEGVLGSQAAPVHDEVRVDPAAGDASWTFGIPLCISSGTTPAIIQSVSPLKTSGTGFRVLGTAVRAFNRTDGDVPVLSSAGWPPGSKLRRDSTRAVAGFVVRTPCSTELLGGGVYTELLIGLARVGTEGGGWHGIAVDYTVGGRHQVLEVDHDIEICGDDVSCEAPR